MGWGETVEEVDGINASCQARQVRVFTLEECE